MSTPTQTNLKLQLNLAELVQAKGLPIWESELEICENLKYESFTVIPNFYDYIDEPDVYFEIMKRYMILQNAIDLNQNRFGEWLDKVFYRTTKCCNKNSSNGSSFYGDMADYYKIEIAYCGLTDKILEELIQSIKTVAITLELNPHLL